MRVLAFFLAALMTLAALTGTGAAKDTLNVGMRLEPAPGLDPTTGAAAAISQITLYNVFEGLTRITESGEVEPGLATSWRVSDDLKRFTFTLRRGVKFADGTDFDAADVKFTFERNAKPASTNKRKRYFTNMTRIDASDPYEVVIELEKPSPVFLFNMGESMSVIVGPESAERNVTHPVGTGPYRFERWVKGDSVALAKNPLYRDAGSVRIAQVVFKFVGDPSAQVAALLAGDIDLFPILGAPESLVRFKDDPRFVVLEGTTEGETILAINNRRKPLDDIRVRRAIAHAIERQPIIDGAMFGHGTPIGTHFAPHHPAYVDLRARYPHDEERARALLAEAGYPGGLTVSLKLPPPTYARRGGEIIASQLAKVGIRATIEPLEWAQWLDVVFKQKNYDLSIVSHVEPLDIGIYADPDYYFQYDSAEFRDLIARADSTADPAERNRYLQMAQRRLSEDAVNGFLFQLAKTQVFRRGLKGVWRNSPIFVNDIAAMWWEE
jgi:peptide/nickel transport system substrate-binding protein